MIYKRGVERLRANATRLSAEGGGSSFTRGVLEMKIDEG